RSSFTSTWARTNWRCSIPRSSISTGPTTDNVSLLACVFFAISILLIRMAQPQLGIGVNGIQDTQRVVLLFQHLPFGPMDRFAQGGSAYEVLVKPSCKF